MTEILIYDICVRFLALAALLASHCHPLAKTAASGAMRISIPFFTYRKYGARCFPIILCERWFLSTYHFAAIVG